MLTKMLSREFAESQKLLCWKLATRDCKCWPRLRESFLGGALTGEPSGHYDPVYNSDSANFYQYWLCAWQTSECFIYTMALIFPRTQWNKTNITFVLWIRKPKFRGILPKVTDRGWGPGSHWSVLLQCPSLTYATLQQLCQWLTGWVVFASHEGFERHLTCEPTFSMWEIWLLGTYKILLSF